MDNCEKIFYILDKKIYNNTDNKSYIIVSSYCSKIETKFEYITVSRYLNDILVNPPLTKSVNAFLNYSKFNINVNEYIKKDILKNKLNTILTND